MKTIIVCIGILALISFGSANAVMYGTQNIQPNTPQSVLQPTQSGYSPADNPYQCPIGNGQYIECMGFAGLDEDLKKIASYLLSIDGHIQTLISAENNNTAELKKICEITSLRNDC